MEKFEIPENPEYTEDIRKFKITDPGHADLMNAVVQALVNNEAFLKKMAEQHIRNKENPHSLTPENIGAPSNEYMSEHFAPDYASSSNGAPNKKGWYRIAMAKQFGAHSCIISIKRRYNSPSPEYQRVQLMDVYSRQKFVSLAAYSGTHFWSKIRYVLDENSSTSYIEIYQDRDTDPNTWIITIEDAVGYNGIYMKAIEPVAAQESVAGARVLASLDLPANFDSDYLARKDGSNINGIWNNLIAGKALCDGDGNSFANTYARKNWIYKGHIKYKGGEMSLNIEGYSELNFIVALSGEDSYNIVKNFNIPTDSLWDYSFGKDVKIGEDLFGIHISRRSNTIIATNNYSDYYVGIYAR